METQTPNIPENSVLRHKIGRIELPSDSSTVPQPKCGPGVHRLGLRHKRDALLYVPERPVEDQDGSPLLVLLHGAGGDPEGMISFLQEAAEEKGVMILAPASQGRTWDFLVGSLGPDVEHIEDGLKYVQRHYKVNPAHRAIGGFSDGASYGLTLGLANGDGVFSHIIAYSPGFMAPPSQQGKPRVYMSHGTGDRVLNIDRCSRRIYPSLKRGEIPVEYKEFEGPHTVPRAIARESLDWFLKS